MNSHLREKEKNTKPKLQYKIVDRYFKNRIERKYENR